MRKPTRPRPSIQILEVDWNQSKNVLSAIRTEVFIEEQGVPPELEWDGLDQSAKHLLALDSDGKPVGCARIIAPGSIGRMAVIANRRGQGIGQALLSTAIAVCKQHGWTKIVLSAQTYAIPFYEKSGFVVTSEVYMDAGIPHRDMNLSYTKACRP
jgi:predicted GNAT family N-acyltransferase